MAIDDPAKKELATLKAKRAVLDRKIQGLELYLGIEQKTSAKAQGISARSVDLDVAPTVRSIFQENGNEPIRKRDLTVMVAERLVSERPIVEAKMVTVRRSILEQAGYGKYRLKQAV